MKLPSTGSETDTPSAQRFRRRQLAELGRRLDPFFATAGVRPHKVI
jgi:hypothetical protein